MAPYLVTFFGKRHGGMAFLHTVFVRDGDLFFILEFIKFPQCIYPLLGIFLVQQSLEDGVQFGRYAICRSGNSDYYSLTIIV